MMKILKADLVGAKELTYQDGKFFFAALREDGLWVAVCLVTRSGSPDQLICGKPYRQILGLIPANDQPLYVAWPNDARDNWPRVVWGESEGKPYEAIDHEHLWWTDGEPLYISMRNGQTFVVRGAREGKPCDKVEGDLSFVAGRPLYRAWRGREMILVWGEFESEPFDHISLPHLDGKEIVAWATKERRIYRLVIKTN